MKLVDMKRTAADKKARDSINKAHSPDGEDYNYGLRVSLGPEELKKLGMGLPKVGDKVRLHAHAHVHSVSQDSDSSGRNHTRVELQLRKLGVGDPDESSEHEDADNPTEERAEQNKKGMRAAMDKVLPKGHSKKS